MASIKQIKVGSTTYDVEPQNSEVLASTHITNALGYVPSQVAVSSTGSAVTEVNYITVNGSEYKLAGGISEVTWGNITGTLSSQTDLQTALDAKSTATNLENGTGTGALQQLLDLEKNPFTNVVEGIEHTNGAAAHYSTVFGGKSYIYSTGKRSIAAGSGSVIKSGACFAIGDDNFIDDDAYNSVVFGYRNQSTTSYSLITGANNKIWPGSSYSLMSGNYNDITYAQSSFICGEHNIIAGTASAQKYSKAVCGEWNLDSDNTLFEVGNGTGTVGATDYRQNAFEVYRDGTAKIGAMGSANLSVVTKVYADTKVSKSGDTMTGDLTLASSKGINITGIAGTDYIKENSGYNLEMHSITGIDVIAAGGLTTIQGGTGLNLKANNGSTYPTASVTITPGASGTVTIDNITVPHGTTGKTFATTADITAAGSNYVAKTGDTMEGQLNINYDISGAGAGVYGGVIMLGTSSDGYTKLEYDGASGKLSTASSLDIKTGSTTFGFGDLGLSCSSSSATLGNTSNKWKDLYLSGSLIDTNNNSLAVASIAKKDTQSVDASSTTATIASADSKIEYRYQTALTSLTISALATSSLDACPIWSFMFIAGSSFTITLPTGVTWKFGTPTFSQGTTYHIIIEKGLANDTYLAYVC